VNPILQFLFLAPVLTSLVLGIVFLLFGDTRPALKLAAALVFFIALYLQFRTRFTLAGLLLQSALALCLAIWKRVATT
jgi:hypothetical protein